LYYAYGIRNSFGLAFDPLTGNLWDTENGPDYGYEINPVQPGFNSGWGKVQGIWYKEISVFHHIKKLQQIYSTNNFYFLHRSCCIRLSRLILRKINSMPKYRPYVNIVNLRSNIVVSLIQVAMQKKTYFDFAIIITLLFTIILSVL
jgi:Glucose / Sorbosone dehydrogenase